MCGWWTSPVDCGRASPPRASIRVPVCLRTDRWPSSPQLATTVAECTARLSAAPARRNCSSRWISMAMCCPSRRTAAPCCITPPAISGSSRIRWARPGRRSLAPSSRRASVEAISSSHRMGAGSRTCRMKRAGGRCTSCRILALGLAARSRSRAGRWPGDLLRRAGRPVGRGRGVGAERHARIRRASDAVQPPDARHSPL